MADEREDDTEQHTGGMIALVPSPSDADGLVADGGTPLDELHLTLAYLGDDVTDWPGEQVAEILDAARGLAADFTPITARILARTVFNEDDAEKDPCAVYLISDSAELGPLRDEATALADVEQHEPYIPHITGGYGLGIDALGGRGSVTFDRLRVALGGQVTDFELSGDEETLDDLDAADDADDAESLDVKAEPAPAAEPASSSGKKRKVASKAGEQRYGLPIGTELGQARGTERARKAQADPNAKARYDDFMTLADPAAMRERARSLSDDDLKSLTEIMYSFKTSNPRVVAARNAMAAELRRRGFDERDHGSMAGGKRAPAARGKIPPPPDSHNGSRLLKAYEDGSATYADGYTYDPDTKQFEKGKPKAKASTSSKGKGSMSATEDRAWRRRAADSGGRIRVSSLTEDARKKLIAAGWVGRAGDGAEALYPPSESKTAETGYLDGPPRLGRTRRADDERTDMDGDEGLERKGRFVRTARGATWFRKPIGSPIRGGGRAVAPNALRRADQMISADIRKTTRDDEYDFANMARGVPDSEIEDVAHVINTEEPGSWRARSINVELEDRQARAAARGTAPRGPSSYNQTMVMLDGDEDGGGSSYDDPAFQAYLRERGVNPDYADDGDVAAWRRSLDGEDDEEDMDYLGLSADGELEVKRTTSKPWEKGKLKKAGHTISKEKGEEGDKYPVKTIGDLAAAVKRAKMIKDPEQKAKVWAHLRKEAARLKAPNMVPKDAPGGDGKAKGGKGGGFVPFKKKGSKDGKPEHVETKAVRAVDYLLSDHDRAVIAAMEFKYASPDPRARRLRKYWAKGPGRAKWSTFRELRRHLSSKGVPAHMLNGLTANIYHAAKGVWPGRKGGEKALDDTTETKVMIAPELVEQAAAVTMLDDDEALAAYEEMAPMVSAEDDYEAAMVAEIDWDLGLDGELVRADVDDDEPAPVLAGFFDEGYEPVDPTDSDLLDTFAG